MTTASLKNAPTSTCAARIGRTIIVAIWLVCILPFAVVFLLPFAVFYFPFPRIEAYSNTAYASGFRPELWNAVHPGTSLSKALETFGEPLERNPADGGVNPPKAEHWRYSYFKEDGWWFSYRLVVDLENERVVEKAYAVEFQD